MGKSPAVAPQQRTTAADNKRGTKFPQIKPKGDEEGPQRRRKEEGFHLKRNPHRRTRKKRDSP